MPFYAFLLSNKSSKKQEKVGFSRKIVTRNQEGSRNRGKKDKPLESLQNSHKGSSPDLYHTFYL